MEALQPTPSLHRSMWAEKILSECPEAGPGPKKQKSAVRKHFLGRWKKRWREYYSKTPVQARVAAQRGEISPLHLGRHVGLSKAESSLAIQIRTEKIGLASFLCRRRVPGFLTEYCSACGRGKRQTAKHVLLFCEKFSLERRELLNGLARMDYRELVDNRQWLKRAARWIMERNLLTQYRLARYCLEDEGWVNQPKVDCSNEKEHGLGSHLT